VCDANVIEMADLRKSYPGVEAVAGLNLGVPRGAICGLLGRNGAGKTTTIKMLLGMVRPTSGTVRVFGLAADDSKSSVEIRRRTSFISDRSPAIHFAATAGIFAGMRTDPTNRPGQR